MLKCMSVIGDWRIMKSMGCRWDRSFHVVKCKQNRMSNCLIMELEYDGCAYEMMVHFFLYFLLYLSRFGVIWSNLDGIK